MTSATTAPPDLQRDLELGKRRRQQREALLAILFVAPATIITFVFRIWPVVFGFYVSLHQWRARTHTFLGLDQYVRALGNAAYVLAFFLCVLFLYGGYRALRGALNAMAEGKGTFFPYLVPGVVLALGAIAFAIGFASQNGDLILSGLGLVVLGGVVYYFVNRQYAQPLSTARYGVLAWQLSVLWMLAVGLFVFTISELLNDNLIVFDLARGLAPDLYLPPLGEQLLWGAIAALALLGIYVARWWRDRLPDEYAYDRLRGILRLVRILLVVAVVVALIYLVSAFQFDQAMAAGVRDFERSEVGEVGQALTGLERADFRTQYGTPNGEDLANALIAWPQIVSITIGFLLMFSAFRTWRQASRSESKLGAGGTVLLAIMVAVAGWLLIGELPHAMAVGDQDYFQALLITVYYATGTVPVQLGLGLFLAYLLFYEIGIGKSLYRVIYFMPYVAPTVATATVFGIIFSSRSYSLANRFMGFFGVQDPLNWLLESKGIFQIIAERIAGPEVALPEFMVGPSLALVSIILYNIWVFSGYNSVIFLAGLGAIPGDLYEAAKVDGAGRWAAFRSITFPLLSPTTFFLTVLGITGTFRAFSHIYVMRQAAARGTADTASVYIFLQFWQFNQWGYASAMAFVLFGIILILTLIQNEVSRGRVFYG
jgi:ABC-type sugar transport system permease subunit